MGVLRAVREDKLEGPFWKKHPSNIEKINRDDLPEEIWKVCQNFAAILPKDLPKGVPPK